MIGVELFGRLGNQCFQIAACVAQAARLDTEYMIPKTTLNNRAFPLYFKHFPHIRSYPILKQYVEPKFGYTPIPLEDDVRLSGYFQSEKYFKEYRVEILKALQFPELYHENVCAIHIRVGDFLQYKDKHPIITADYLDAAIKKIYDETGVKTFRLFSDDIGYAKKLIESRLYYGVNFEYSEGRTPVQDVYTMSTCGHFIIANSTFSWWGAWACANQDKVVVTPHEDNWFGIGNKHLDVSDLLPEEWIRLKY